MIEINNLKGKSKRDSVIGNSEFKEYDFNFGVYRK